MALWLQYVALFLNMVGVVWISGYLDHNSTMSFLKRKSSTEWNWFVRQLIWLAAKWRFSWLWPKLAVAAALSGFMAYFGLLLLGLGPTIAVMTVFNAYYFLFVVNRNYTIARGD